jgi:dihydrolipoamide dehydrogenase
VGLTEAQAKDKYGEVETYEYNLGGNGKSQILQTQGFVKLVRQKDGPVVGVHMIGARMGEQVGEAQLIYNWEALPSDVAALVWSTPIPRRTSPSERRTWPSPANRSTHTTKRRTSRCLNA